MKKYILIALTAIMAAGCVDMYKPMQVGEDAPVYLMMTGTNKTAVDAFPIETAGESYTLSVSAAGKVKEDITVKLAWSDKALARYNKAHKTSFVALPEEAIEFDTNEVVIKAGSAVSSAATVTVVSTESMEDGVVYAIPVTMVSAKGGKAEMVDASRTLVVRLAKKVNFFSLVADQAGLSSNFIFAEPINLRQFTYEVKVYPMDISSKSDMPSRLCAFEQGDESKSFLYRFNEATNVEGESNRTCNRLQVKVGDPAVISKTKFAVNSKWYMITVTCDGAIARLYVDGEEEASVASSPGEIAFQRFELGMSYQGYNSSQLCKTRWSEVRIWDRALSKGEINEGLCIVSPKAEGLKAYWKMDEGSGYVFHNSAVWPEALEEGYTGPVPSDYDMDWSRTKRAKSGDTLTDTPEAANSVKWIKDNNNICIN